MEQNPVILLFLALGIIIAASRIAGAIARQFDQPRVLGELIVGVLLGPTVLNFLHWELFGDVHLEVTIKELAELGVLFLMFIVGLEVHLNELVKVGKAAALGGFAGATLPVLMTVPVILLADYGWEAALFGGVILAATSVSISAQVLFELGYLKTKEGNALLATALVDDVLAILFVSITIAITANSGGANASELILIVVQMVVYLVIAGLLAWYVLPQLMNRISTIPSLSQAYGIPTIAVVFMLIFGWSAEALGGVATITGAFIAGIGLSQSKVRIKEEITTSVRSIAYVFLIPIFFVDVGLETDLGTFFNNISFESVILATSLLLVAVVSKVGGSGIGVRLANFTNKESLRLGVCMISRGEVGLIIAGLAVSSGIISQSSELYASLFLVILLTTVVTPPFVRWVFADHETATNV